MFKEAIDFFVRRGVITERAAGYLPYTLWYKEAINWYEPVLDFKDVPLLKNRKDGTISLFDKKLTSVTMQSTLQELRKVLDYCKSTNQLFTGTYCVDGTAVANGLQSKEELFDLGFVKRPNLFLDTGLSGKHHWLDGEGSSCRKMRRLRKALDGVEVERITQGDISQEEWFGIIERCLYHFNDVYAAECLSYDLTLANSYNSRVFRLSRDGCILGYMAFVQNSSLMENNIWEFTSVLSLEDRFTKKAFVACVLELVKEFGTPVINLTTDKQPFFPDWQTYKTDMANVVRPVYSMDFLQTLKEDAQAYFKEETVCLPAYLNNEFKGEKGLCRGFKTRLDRSGFGTVLSLQDYCSDDIEHTD